MHIASGGIQILVLHLDPADNIYESKKHHIYKNIVTLRIRRIQITCRESQYVDIASTRTQWKFSVISEILKHFCTGFDEETFFEHPFLGYSQKCKKFFLTK